MMYQEQTDAVHEVDVFTVHQQQPMLLSPLSTTATDECNNTDVDPSMTTIMEHQQQTKMQKSMDGVGVYHQLQVQLEQRQAASLQSSNAVTSTKGNEGCKLFVGGLPKDVTAEEFHDYFVQYGEIIDSFIVYDRENGKPRGFGFVTFADANVCRQLLNIYHQNDVSTTKTDGSTNNTTVVSDEETNTDSISTPVVTRLQMRGRFIELKIAQPRDAATTYANNYKTYLPANNRPPRRFHPYQNHHHQYHPNQHYPRSYHHQYQHQYQYHPSTHTTTTPHEIHDPTALGQNEYSNSDDGSYYNHIKKVPATLSQQNMYNNGSVSGGRYSHSNAMMQLPPVPMTPGGPLMQQQYSLSSSLHQSYKHSPVVGVPATPGTPSQKVLDIAHHMLFYAQLLATPSMPSTSYDDLYHRHPDEILKIDENIPLSNDEMESATTLYMEPSQPPPRPCSPSLSVPDVIVSPSKKRSTTSEIFSIGGGTFYPDTSVSTTITPLGLYSPSKGKKSSIGTSAMTAEIPKVSSSSSLSETRPTKMITTTSSSSSSTSSTDGSI